MVERCLEKMDDIHYCPRPSCRTACIILSREDNTCLCSACHFCFCILCQKSSHGKAPCAVNSDKIKRLMQRYNEAVATGDNQTITDLKRQYGENLQRFIDLQSTMQFIKENSVQCPKCGQAIQKTEGCNKMNCSTCQVRFDTSFERKLTAINLQGFNNNCLGVPRGKSTPCMFNNTFYFFI